MESDYGTHEILDRAALAHHFFSENVMEHSRLGEFPNLKRMAAVCDTALAEFYQACGQEFRDRDSDGDAAIAQTTSSPSTD